MMIKAHFSDTCGCFNKALTERLQEILSFRTNLAWLCNYDWVPIPIAYPQVSSIHLRRHLWRWQLIAVKVVFLAVRSYFLICLVSRQFLIRNSVSHHAKVSCDKGVEHINEEGGKSLLAVLWPAFFWKAITRRSSTACEKNNDLLKFVGDSIKVMISDWCLYTVYDNPAVFLFRGMDEGETFFRNQFTKRNHLCTDIELLFKNNDSVKSRTTRCDV